MQKKSAAEMVVGWPDSMLASSTLLKNVLRPRDLICCWESYVLMLQKNKKQKTKKLSESCAIYFEIHIYVNDDSQHLGV